MKKILTILTLFVLYTQIQAQTSINIITREEATEKIMTAKAQKKLTFQQIADAVGKDEVWVASAMLGQNTMTADEAKKACTSLGLGQDVELALQVYATRGTTQEMPPTDPLVYRFYEIVMIYGPTLKAVIQEEFGEGIMSAINFSMKVDRVPHPEGDRVKVTMEGKFLDYKKW
ncbi:MAG: cyanase [Fimbriimonadaceae bacterium]|nr:cyanase [Chitinophagales bacterium]